MSFIPLSELQGERISIALPEYVPEEQIGINVDRLDKIAGLGGFTAGATVTSFAGRTTEVQPSIVGSDRQGTAYAGASTIRRADASDEEFTVGKSWVEDHGSLPLNIRVNMPEIMQRITNAQGRLRDPGPWARELNSAVTDSLRRASWQHYVRSPRYGEFFPLAFGALCGEVFTRGVADTPTAIGSLLLVSNAIKVIWGRWQGLQMNEICWSATPVVHPDRALIVSGMSRALKIVKQLPAAA